MKKKSFIMPIVLMVFSIVVIISIAVYYRYIGIYNFKNAKEQELLNKLEKISIEEIIKSKATHNFINDNLIGKKSLKKKFSINQIVYEKFLNEDFLNKYDKNYKFYLNIKQIKTDTIFSNKINKFPSPLYNYNVYFKILNERTNSSSEYKFVDKRKIENYLLDMQLYDFINNKKSKNKDKFYFKLSDSNKNLYERIFEEENGDIANGDFRIFNIGNDVFYISNSEYIKLLNKYLLDKIDTEKVKIEDDLSVDIVDLEEFFSQELLNGCSKMEFIKNYLLEYSNIICKNGNRSIVNFIAKEKIYFDFDRNLEIYMNLNLKYDDADIFITEKIPEIKGIFVNNSDKTFNFKLNGLLFSKIENNIDYKFNPAVIDRVTRLIKISDDYYIETIDSNNIK